MQIDKIKKHKRILKPDIIPRDKDYLIWLNEQYCCATYGLGKIDAHHITFMRGSTNKGPDQLSVPLEMKQHRIDLHTVGERTFWLAKLRRNLQLLKEVIRAYGLFYWLMYKTGAKDMEGVLRCLIEMFEEKK